MSASSNAISTANIIQPLARPTTHSRLLRASSVLIQFPPWYLDDITLIAAVKREIAQCRKSGNPGVWTRGRGPDRLFGITEGELEVTPWRKLKSRFLSQLRFLRAWVY